MSDFYKIYYNITEYNEDKSRISPCVSWLQTEDEIYFEEKHNPKDPVEFEDSNVKKICDAKYDIDKDGHFSYQDAAAVSSISFSFNVNSSYKIKSFNELKYFTKMTSLSRSAFYNQDELESVVIPQKVTSIASRSFMGCSSLFYISLPKNLQYINSEAFKNCTSLSNLTLPSEVMSIMRESFSGCCNIVHFNFPKKLKSIGQGAFQYCSSLEYATIPESVTSIGADAFKDCTSLTSCYFDRNTTIGARAFMGCTSLIYLRIPDQYNIQADIYNGCKNATSADSIGPNVKIISSNAFYGCTGLDRIVIESEKIQEVSDGAFDNTNNCPIYVPASVLDSYKTGVFKNYADRLQASEE